MSENELVLVEVIGVAWRAEVEGERPVGADADHLINVELMGRAQFHEGFNGLGRSC